MAQGTPLGLKMVQSKLRVRRWIGVFTRCQGGCITSVTPFARGSIPQGHSNICRSYEAVLGKPLGFTSTLLELSPCGLVYHITW